MTAYGSRLERFAAWCEREDIDAFAADVRTIRRYLAELSREQVAPRTLAAHLSAIRSLYRWMAAEGIVEGDAVSAIASPKLPRDLPGVLTTKQVEALLKTPDPSTPAGLRDAAMLELLYASGARISELAALNVESIAWSERTLRLWGKGSKERIVPLYRRALEATRLYIEEGRPELLAQAKRRDPATGPHPLLISARGNRMSAAMLRRRFHTLRRSPAFRPTSPRMRCAIPLRPTCSRAARTCARFKSCWVMRACPRRRSTRISHPIGLSGLWLKPIPAANSGWDVPRRAQVCGFDCGLAGRCIPAIIHRVASRQQVYITHARLLHTVVPGLW